MLNKGFSIVECIFCILFISSGIAGIIIPMSLIKNDYDRKYYESIISINHYSIFSLFTADPVNAEENIVRYLDGRKLEDGNIEVKLKLERVYKGKEEVIFNIKISESNETYSIEVYVEGVLEYYEKINQTYVAKREIEK